jgi:hypothetical protein
MSEEMRGSKTGGETESGVETMVGDVFGVDFKLPRTLRDLVFRPGRVADAAVAFDHSRYTRPLRVFLAIFAATALLYGWVGVYEAASLAAGLASDTTGSAAIEARLASAGLTLAEADAILVRWTSWTSWPVTALSSLGYGLVIWLLRPRLGLVKALLLYLVSTNGASLVSVPFIAAGALFGQQVLVAVSLFAFLISFVYFALVLHRRAAGTATGLILRVVALVFATLPVVFLAGVLIYGVVEAGFRIETGLWRSGLMIEAAVARSQQ